MSLPSQSPRSRAIGRAIVRTHRRRRPRFQPLAAAAAIVIAGVAITWFVFLRSDGSLSPESASARGGDLDEVLEAPYGGTAEPARPANSETPTVREARTPSAEPPPFEIRQGGGAQASGLSAALSSATTQERRSPDEQMPGRQPPADPTLTSDARGGNPSGAGDAASAGSADTERAVRAARAKLDANDPVAARSILSRALANPLVSPGEAADLRAMLTTINERLVFSAEVFAGDPLVGTYTIERGDALSALPGKLGLAVDWRVIQHINRIPNPNQIRLGQKLKTLRGPFHAVVDKSDYRLDLYAGAPDEPGQWMYIRSFRVGLGEDNSTPTGSFVVKRNSKLVNPHWVNPRTGQKFDANNPENPIGEHWVGIEGLGGDAIKTGYGLHGTIDPSSIGKQMSMGCVRMLDEDVALMYGLLVEGISRVQIRD